MPPPCDDHREGREHGSARVPRPAPETLSSPHSAQWLVRPAGDLDRGRWAELFLGFADFYHVQQSATSTQLVWSWIRDPQNDLRCLLVEDRDGRVAGLAHYRTFPRPLSASIGCYLDNLFVDPAARGTGASDALLRELRRLARVSGWTVVRWVTAPDNDRAIAKYEKCASRTAWLTYDMSPDEAKVSP
jgi:GNAT superfamily N-acetyltransferase